MTSPAAMPRFWHLHNMLVIMTTPTMFPDEQLGFLQPIPFRITSGLFVLQGRGWPLSGGSRFPPPADPYALCPGKRTGLEEREEALRTVKEMSLRNEISATKFIPYSCASERDQPQHSNSQRVVTAASSAIPSRASSRYREAVAGPLFETQLA